MVNERMREASCERCPLPVWPRNRETGKGVGITLFDSEDAMRRGDEALNAMNPGASERRVSVEFFEVPVETIT